MVCATLVLRLCNTPPTPGLAAVTAEIYLESRDWSQIPALVFHVHFILTSAYSGGTFCSVTHVKIVGQAHLTSELYRDEFSKKGAFY